MTAQPQTEQPQANDPAEAAKPVEAAPGGAPVRDTGAPDTAAPDRQPVSGVDTVEIAGRTPDEDQPYADLGLRGDEYARIRQILGRRPTQSELAMYSIMWSEHCSYK